MMINEDERRSLIKCITFLIRSFVFVIMSVVFLIIVCTQYPKIVEQYGSIPLLYNLIYYIISPSILIICITKFIDCIVINQIEEPDVFGEPMAMAWTILMCCLAILFICTIVFVYGIEILDFFKNLFIIQ